MRCRHSQPARLRRPRITPPHHAHAGSSLDGRWSPHNPWNAKAVRRSSPWAEQQAGFRVNYIRYRYKTCAGVIFTWPPHPSYGSWYMHRATLEVLSCDSVADRGSLASIACVCTYQHAWAYPPPFPKVYTPLKVHQKREAGHSDYTQPCNVVSYSVFHLPIPPITLSLLGTRDAFAQHCEYYY